MIRFIHTHAFRQAAALFLALLLLCSVCPAAHAEEVGGLTVYGPEGQHALAVLKQGHNWFVRASDLAALADLSFSENDITGAVNLYKESPFTLLYTIKQGACVRNGGDVYVPLADASSAAGIRFFEYEGGLHYEVLRTPKQLVAELSANVFANERFRLSELYLGLGTTWTVLETTARGYAILSDFSLSAYAKAITGEDDQERYNQAMATIICNDDATVSGLSDLADIDKLFTKTDKVLDTFDWLFEKGTKFSYWFLGSDWTEAEFKTIRDQIEFYGEYGGAREFLGAYSDASKALDLNYLFDVLLFIETVKEAEESTVQAMQRVFVSSDNEHTKKAAAKVLANRYGLDLTANDQMESAVKEAAFNNADSIFDDLAFSEVNWKQKVAKFVVTQISKYGFHLPEKADAVIYLPIYSAIQQELSSYYYRHNADLSPESAADLRAVGIMYLKAGIAAYDNFSFDSAIHDSVSLAIDTMRKELNELLSYGEIEYAPDYTNQAVVDWLNQRGTEAPPTTTAAPRELFDETFWDLSFGQTLGSSFVALFHEDGTFTARSYGSGMYDSGTYTYENGVLTIDFWAIGRGVVFEGGPDGFASREEYPMQVGSGSYWISPISGVADFYYEDDPYNSGSSSPSEPPEVLTDGDYYGRPITWNDSTMTLELLEFAGRHPDSLNYMLNPTGQTVTLDISDASIYLDFAWAQETVKCLSFDDALSYRPWDGRDTILDYMGGPPDLSFTVKNGRITEMILLYAA